MSWCSSSIRLGAEHDRVVVDAVERGVVDLVGGELVVAAAHRSGRVDDHEVVDRRELLAQLVEQLGVVGVEVLLDEGEEPLAALAVPVVLEREVAPGGRLGAIELELDRGPVDVGVGVGRALLGAVLVAVLERGHPVEPAAVGHRVVRIGPGHVADRQHAGDGLVEVDVVLVEALGLAVGHPLRPRTGEAVGLQLEVDRAVGDADPVLHGVAVLVGDHDGHGEGAELFVEPRHELALVPGDDVVVGAVEGVVGDLFVGDLVRPARGHLGVGPVGVEAGEVDPLVAVDVGVGVAPELGDVVDGSLGDGRGVVGRLGRRRTVARSAGGERDVVGCRLGTRDRQHRRDAERDQGRGRALHQDSSMVVPPLAPPGGAGDDGSAAV